MGKRFMDLSLCFENRLPPPFYLFFYLFIRNIGSRRASVMVNCSLLATSWWYLDCFHSHSSRLKLCPISKLYKWLCLSIIPTNMGGRIFWLHLEMCGFLEENIPFYQSTLTVSPPPPPPLPTIKYIALIWIRVEVNNSVGAGAPYYFYMQLSSHQVVNLGVFCHLPWQAFFKSNFSTLLAAYK